MDHNATKGGVDNMDKLTTAYSCKRRTLRRPQVIFFEMLDISPYTFVIWMAVNKDSNKGKYQTSLSRGTEKGTAETSNSQKTLCSRNTSFVSHHEENSGGGCWFPIHLTYRTTIYLVWSNCVMLLQKMSDIYALRERERGVCKISDLFIILGCCQQQQKEALQSRWTQVGQENSIHMQEV